MIWSSISSNKALFLGVLCNLGVQYNNGISLSEDDIPCDERTDLWLESISCLEKSVAWQVLFCSPLDPFYLIKTFFLHFLSTNTLGLFYHFPVSPVLSAHEQITDQYPYPDYIVDPIEYPEYIEYVDYIIDYPVYIEYPDNTETETETLPEESAEIIKAFWVIWLYYITLCVFVCICTSIF